MNLADVMDEVGDLIDTIQGLRVFRHPPSTVTPPAAIVTYPETYTYDETFGRGSDRMDLRVVLLVGKVSDRSARDRIGAYVDGSGPRSIKAVLEADEYTAFDSARVRDVEFDIVAMARVEYLAATLTIDIIGPGS